MPSVERECKVPENGQDLGFHALGQDFKSPVGAFAVAGF